MYGRSRVRALNEEGPPAIDLRVVLLTSFNRYFNPSFRPNNKINSTLERATQLCYRNGVSSGTSLNYRVVFHDREKNIPHFNIIYSTSKNLYFCMISKIAAQLFSLCFQQIEKLAEEKVLVCSLYDIHGDGINR